MTIVDKLSYLDLVVDYVVDFVVFLVVELLGYRWGQIVNRHDVSFVELDSYEIYRLVKVLLNLERPEMYMNKKFLDNSIFFFILQTLSTFIPEAFRIAKIELVQNVK